MLLEPIAQGEVRRRSGQEAKGPPVVRRSLFCYASQVHHLSSREKSGRSIFAMPHQDPNIIREAPNEVIELARLAVTGELALLSDFLACDFNFEFMLLFVLVRPLSSKSAHSSRSNI